METTPRPPLASPCTAFMAGQKLASGDLADVALAVNARIDRAETAILIFDDGTGAEIDIDLRGTTAQIIARLASYRGVEPETRKRGRPKLGVVAREITLLPRQWDWLALQPGGASQALRRLVDQASKADDGRTATRLARERAYRFMSALAGDYPGFEDATRALFADDAGALVQAMTAWPEDVRAHALRLAQSDDDQATPCP